MASQHGRRGILPDDIVLPKKLRDKNKDGNEDSSSSSSNWSSDDDDNDSDNDYYNGGTFAFDGTLSSCHANNPARAKLIRSLVPYQRNLNCVICGEKGGKDRKDGEEVRIRRDESRNSTLSCTRCKDVYHRKCLKKRVIRDGMMGDGSWYCKPCRIFAAEEEADDGLERMVNSLGPEFRNRFGEVCWAAGGPGFGWWPAIVYDPRLTDSSARSLAKKNLGKMHLVYFFDCNEAPFTVLPPEKLVDWEVGLVWGYDQGVAARASGSAKRITSFEGALQQAHVEYNKPVEFRCDWNHDEDILRRNSSKTVGKLPRISSPVEDETVSTSLQSKSDQKPWTRISKYQLRRELNFLNEAKRSAKMWRCGIPEAIKRLKDQTHARNVIGITRTNRRNFDFLLSNDSKESDLLHCKFMLRQQKANAFCICHIAIPHGRESCFSEGRKLVERLSPSNLPKNWKFYVPKLGPISKKQESTLQIWSFLNEVNARYGEGSRRNPIRIILQNAA